MKTHLPTGLRKALIAALVAVSAVAYNAQADLIDLNNASKGTAETATLGTDYESTGYADLTFSGTNETLASGINHKCHDYNDLGITSTRNDYSGDSTKITAAVSADGVFRLHSITVEDKDGTGYEETTYGGDQYYHNHSASHDFGYSTACSEGNLTVKNSAIVEVASYVDAEGTINLNNHGILTSTNGNINGDAGITVTDHSVLTANNGNITTDGGNITASEYSRINAENGTVSAGTTGTVKADGINSSVTATEMKGASLIADNGGHLDATNMTGDVTATGTGSAVSATTIIGDVTAQNAGAVNTTNITGDVLAVGTGSEVTATNITGDVTAKDAGTVNATTITGSATADNATLNATTITNGAAAKNGGTLTATNISGGAYTETNGTIQTDKQINGSVSGSNGVIAATAGQGLTITENLTADGDTLITGAGETVTIGTTGDGNISGSNNTIGSSADHSTTVASNIQVKGDISGSGNKLSATGTNLTDGISALAVGGDISGDGNKLTVSDEGDIVVGGDVAGDANNLTIMGDGDISVLDDITGDSNSLTVEGDGSISVSDAVSGDGNTLSTEGEGDITVTVLGREIDTDVVGDKGASSNTLTAADGDITIESLSDNVSLTVTATEGTVTVLEDSAATLADSAISAKGDITIGEDAVSTDVLKLTEGTTVTSDEGDIVINQTSETDASTIEATTGNVTLAGTTNTVQNGSSVSAAETVTIEGTTNTIDASSVTATGTSVAEGADSLTITGTNTISGGATVTADNGNITMSTATTVKDSGTKVTATTGDITATGTSATIKDSAAVEATAGDVTLSATTNTVANNATVEAAETVTIEGTTNTIDASSVTAIGTGVAEGEDALTITGTNTISGGATVKAENGNITLSTATTIQDSNTKLTATTGDIAITGTSATIKDSAAVEATEGNVTLSATTNNVESGAKVTAADTISLENTTEISGNATLTAETIDVTEGAVVNMGASSADALAGKLSGTGTINAVADDLNLSYDDTAFTGTVNMNAAKKLTISDKGVGAEAAINLNAVGSSLEVTAADASLGHLTAGSGSEVRLNPGTPTGTATASTLAMGAGSTLHIDTTDGTVADAITITESVSVATPGTVYVNGGAQDALAAIDGDTSVTIIKLEDGAVNEGVSEDVKFDMDGTQRVLQDKNMSLVSTKDGVQLVISDNFRGVENTAANQTAVNDTMKALSAAADHTAGALAASDSKLDNILDALDNTRSTGETKHALQQLSAAGNLVVPNMMMDTTRHHLSTLRSHMGAPSCNGTVKGGNAWVAYTGGHDAINGDGATGDYTRTHQGALLGSDYSVSCNASVGLSLGYENSIGRMDGTRAESDTVFADLYATVKQGKLTHRFSAGVAVYDIDVTRHVGIAAGGHTYMGNSTGSMDAISWNLGYEISRDVKLGAASTLTPFAAIDLSFHQLDTLNESGQGDASVTTNYDDPVQLDIAAGVAYTRTFRSFTADSSALSVSAALHGELSKHRPTADNHFVGGGQSWKTRSSERTPLYGELGASVAVPVYKTTSLIGGGNFEFSEDRVSVGGNIGVNVKF